MSRFQHLFCRLWVIVSIWWGILLLRLELRLLWLCRRLGYRLHQIVFFQLRFLGEWFRALIHLPNIVFQTQHFIRRMMIPFSWFVCFSTGRPNPNRWRDLCFHNRSCSKQPSDPWHRVIWLLGWGSLELHKCRNLRPILSSRPWFLEGLNER